jgi:hypothetical protein
MARFYKVTVTAHLSCRYTTAHLIPILNAHDQGQETFRITRTKQVGSF